MTGSTVSKKATAGLLLPFLLAGSFFSLGGADMEVVGDQKSSYAIVVPEKASPNLAREYRNAAMLLKRLIRRRTGANLPVLSESKMSPGRKAIFIGRTAAALKSGAEKAQKARAKRREKAESVTEN